MNDPKKEFELSAGTFTPTDLAIVSGAGASVKDSTGKEYIDCVGGHGVASVGHGNPKVAIAVQKAWQNYAFTTARHPHEIRQQFLTKLAEKMPNGVNKFFLSSSGAEANEAALKFARLATGRTQILAAKRGFHGRTFGALSATWRPEFRQPFEPLVPDFDFFAFNKAETLAEKISDKTAAVILEVIQGEGGVYVAELEFLKQMRKLCDEHGALLILDEVQTGVCRTGRFLALEHFGIQPDIVTMAKALAGGYPIGVTAIRHDLFKTPPRGLHNTTFGGSAPACAAALAVLEFCESEKLAEQAAEKGVWLKAELEKIDSPKIKEVRGLGLMLAVELTVPAMPIVAALKEVGVLVLPAGPKTIRLLPPLVIAQVQLEEVVKQLAEALK